ncbi:hypothetical protein [Gaetbulibacter saemankumensis]|uniref:hypothetical protein n=1 Tax=Gaetbulibacter saemankumensis TaxID=311208 RepID=UPI0003FDC35E|nr:hypothetical protein [Gaetbulibacter saemankumensis]
MIKQSIAIFFTALFMAQISAPSVIIALDDTFDTSVFYSFSEEEENGKSKNLISPFSLINHDSLTSFSFRKYEVFRYMYGIYPKPHLNLISPPPDQNIYS